MRHLRNPQRNLLVANAWRERVFPADSGDLSHTSRHQSSQNDLNRSGDSSVQRTVCLMFLCRRSCWSARVSCPSFASLYPSASSGTNCRNRLADSSVISASARASQRRVACQRLNNIEPEPLIASTWQRKRATPSSSGNSPIWLASGVNSPKTLNATDCNDLHKPPHDEPPHKTPGSPNSITTHSTAAAARPPNTPRRHGSTPPPNRPPVPKIREPRAFQNPCTAFSKSVRCSSEIRAQFFQFPCFNQDPAWPVFSGINALCKRAIDIPPLIQDPHNFSNLVSHPIEHDVRMGDD